MFKQIGKHGVKTIQAHTMVKWIIHMNVDQMPRLMKDIKNRHSNVWKIPPSSLTWEKVQEEVNKVSIYDDIKEMTLGGTSMFCFKVLDI